MTEAKAVARAISSSKVRIEGEVRRSASLCLNMFTSATPTSLRFKSIAASQKISGKKEARTMSQLASRIKR